MRDSASSHYELHVLLLRVIFSMLLKIYSKSILRQWCYPEDRLNACNAAMATVNNSQHIYEILKWNITWLLDCIINLLSLNKRLAMRVLSYHCASCKYPFTARADLKNRSFIFKPWTICYYNRLTLLFCWIQRRTFLMTWRKRADSIGLSDCLATMNFNNKTLRPCDYDVQWKFW